MYTVPPKDQVLVAINKGARELTNDAGIVTEPTICVGVVLGPMIEDLLSVPSDFLMHPICQIF